MKTLLVTTLTFLIGGPSPHLILTRPCDKYTTVSHEGNRVKYNTFSGVDLARILSAQPLWSGHFHHASSSPAEWPREAQTRDPQPRFPVVLSLGTLSEGSPASGGIMFTTRWWEVR